MSMTFRRAIFLGVAVLAIGAVLSPGQQPIQTQSHNILDGVQVDLTSLEVRNNIVTVKFQIRNTGAAKQGCNFSYKDCYIMDETNQKKYFALKDADGLFIAGPMYDDADGGRFWFDIGPGQSKGFWIKFPNPTDNPKSIVISIPDVSPFEEIPLGR